jgi:hypothetical protein
MALGGILLSSSYKRSSARALGCAGSAEVARPKSVPALGSNRDAGNAQRVVGLDRVRLTLDYRIIPNHGRKF